MCCRGPNMHEISYAHDRDGPIFSLSSASRYSLPICLWYVSFFLFPSVARLRAPWSHSMDMESIDGPRLATELHYLAAIEVCRIFRQLERNPSQSVWNEWNSSMTWMMWRNCFSVLKKIYLSDVPWKVLVHAAVLFIEKENVTAPFRIVGPFLHFSVMMWARLRLQENLWMCRLYKAHEWRSTNDNQNVRYLPSVPSLRM